MDEAVTGPVEDLELRTEGVLEVVVGEARGMHGGGGWLTGAHPQVSGCTRWLPGCAAAGTAEACRRLGQLRHAAAAAAGQQLGRLGSCLTCVH
jgi:hypothetical protein